MGQIGEIKIMTPFHVAIVSLTAFMIWATHYWVRYHHLFINDNGKEWKIIGRYITGVSSIMYPLTLLCWEHGWWQQLKWAWGIAALAGFTTLALYGCDKLFKEDEERIKKERLRGDNAVKDLEKIGHPVE